MKLVANFPKNSDFARSKLYDIPGDRKRLVLSVEHVVNGKIGNIERVGKADIFYNLDFEKTVEVGANIDTTGSLYVGVQSVDYIAQAVQKLRTRTSYAIEHVANGKFDLRALLAVCGTCNAAGAAGADVTFSKSAAGYSTLGTGFSVPDLGRVMVGPNVAQTPEEFVTMLAMCGSVGVKNVTILSDRVPASSASLLTGRALSTFAFRFAQNLLASAADSLAYGTHAMAFEHGKTHAMVLNGHSDEGGWIRSLMKSAVYPVPCGIVSGMNTQFCGYPLQESMELSEALRLCVSTYLEFVALIPVADHTVNGGPSVYTRDPESDGRPGDYGLFTHHAYDVLSAWKDLLCDINNQHHDSVVDDATYASFFQDDARNAHFVKTESIVPWFFVEPSPLLMQRYEAMPVPAFMGGVTELPLFHQGSVSYNSPYLDSLGRVVPGTDIWLTRSAGSYRDMGASYLLSPRYHVDNGLSQLTVCDAPDGTPSYPMAFVDNGNVNVGAHRWQTSHNPMPHPVEGLASGKTTMHYRSVDIEKDFTVYEAQAGKVYSRFSVFKVRSVSPDAKFVTHRHVPKALRKKLRNLRPFEGDLTTLEIKTLGTSQLAPRVEQEFEETDKPGDSIIAVREKEEIEEKLETKTVTVSPADTGVTVKSPTIKGATRKDGSDESEASK